MAPQNSTNSILIGPSLKCSTEDNAKAFPQTTFILQFLAEVKPRG